VLRQRKIIDDGIAVDIMRDGLILDAVPELRERENLSRLGARAQLPRCGRLVHGRYACLHVYEEGAWRRFTHRQKMRFRWAFKECGKYGGRNLGARVHSDQ